VAIIGKRFLPPMMAHGRYYRPRFRNLPGPPFLTLLKKIGMRCDTVAGVYLSVAQLVSRRFFRAQRDG
jgi:hypothetical protein